MLTETSMKETGRTIKLTVTESTCTPTEQGTRVSGKKISSMEKVLKDGLMALFMMESTMKGKNMGEELFSGATIQSSLVNLRTITSKVMALINGTMVENTTATGKITKCMEKESLLGLMAENIQAHIKKI